MEPQHGPNANYYHGEDINLYSNDQEELEKNRRLFFREALNRFGLLHFAGGSCMSFSPDQSLLMIRGTSSNGSALARSWRMLSADAIAA
jgi:hypothetical protein